MQLILFLILNISNATQAPIPEFLRICSASLNHPTINGESPHGLNHLSLQYQDLNMPENHPARYRSDTLSVHQGESAYFESSKWTHKIEKLSFSLGTESYGANYSLETCYFRLGPIPNNDRGLYAWTLQIQLKGKDIAKYFRESKLVYYTDLQCDLKQMGANRNQFNPENFEVDWQQKTNLAPASANINLQIAMNSRLPNTPLGCSLKIHFMEIVENKKRSHKMSIEEIEVNSSISENIHQGMY